MKSFMACLTFALLLVAPVALTCYVAADMPAVRSPVAKWKRTVEVGVLQSDFDQFGQWNNAPKPFFLVTYIAGVQHERKPLAFADEAMRKECERHTNWPVEATLIEVKREVNSWYVVESIEPLK